MIIENQKFGFGFWVSSKERGQERPHLPTFCVGHLKGERKSTLGAGKPVNGMWWLKHGLYL
jgi:hypothetical protein